MSSSTVLKLGYWNIRGLAQSVRYLLEFTTIPWEDVLYKQAGPTDPIPFDKSCWFDVKEGLGLDFPNLPYLIDESRNIRLTQSQAIIRYIARLCPSLNLLGAEIEEQAKVDMLLAEFADCKGRMTGLQYSAGVEEAGAAFIAGDDFTSLHPTLVRFSRYLGPREWFVGSAPTVADFVIYEYIACASLYSNAYISAQQGGPLLAQCEDGSEVQSRPDGLGPQHLINAYPNLMRFKVRFESLPTIAAYLTSDRFDDVRAMNNQHAKFR